MSAQSITVDGLGRDTSDEFYVLDLCDQTMLVRVQVGDTQHAAVHTRDTRRDRVGLHKDLADGWTGWVAYVDAINNFTSEPCPRHDYNQPPQKRR